MCERKDVRLLGVETSQLLAAELLAAVIAHDGGGHLAITKLGGRRSGGVLGQKLVERGFLVLLQPVDSPLHYRSISTRLSLIMNRWQEVTPREGADLQPPGRFTASSARDLSKPISRRVSRSEDMMGRSGGVFDATVYEGVEGAAAA